MHLTSRYDLYLDASPEAADGNNTKEEAATRSQLAATFFRMIQESKKPQNLGNSKLTKRESIFRLIEHNRDNFIYCPFDEFAYSRLKSKDPKY